jgi:hypothetical protein
MKGYYRFSFQRLEVADTGDELIAKTIILNFKSQSDQCKLISIATTEAAVTLLESKIEAHQVSSGVMTPAMLRDRYAKNLQRPKSDVDIVDKVED